MARTAGPVLRPAMVAAKTRRTEASSRWSRSSTRSAGVAGRWAYESAGRWGGTSPWGLPVFIVTHRPEEEPAGGDFRFVRGLEVAIEQAKAAAGDKDVHVMGGADVIRQALAGGHVDGLSIIVAPVILGGGKRLFEGFGQSLELEHIGVRQSELATFIDYRVSRREPPVTPG